VKPGEKVVNINMNWTVEKYMDEGSKESIVTRGKSSTKQKKRDKRT
jgi:hypothetical protein